MTPDGRITVLHFANSPVRAGAEEHMLMLLSRLNRARFRPMLVAHPVLVESFGSDLPVDVPVYPIALEGPLNVRSMARFGRVIRKCRVDIVHSHMFQASRLASPLAWMAGATVALETPHVREHWRKGLIKGNYLLDRLVGRFVDTYIAVSKANRDYLVGIKGLPSRKIAVVQNGISLERFNRSGNESARLLRSVGISDDAPVVGVFARLEPQKGHRILLDAWQSVVESFPNARLLILGDGSLRGELNTQIARLGIGGSVVMLGYQKNVAEWLNAMRFTVLPSFYEGLPLAAMESLAAGRTVVATAVDGTSEVVIDGETGLLVPSGDSAALAAAIARLIASPELAESLGRCGRRFVERHFSDVRQVEETESVYEAALQSVQHPVRYRSAFGVKGEKVG